MTGDRGVGVFGFGLPKAPATDPLAVPVANVPPRRLLEHSSNPDKISTPDLALTDLLLV